MARVIGYYKKKGKTRPITESKGKSSFHGQTNESNWKQSSMNDIKASIKDEDKGAKEYDRLADEAPTKKEKLALQGMAKDERRHKATLKKIDPPDEKWIHEAIEDPGSYRASVKRRFGNAGFTEKGTIKREVIQKDAKKKGKLGKQARLAQTLRNM